jgi:subtilase family serine protease
MRRTATAILSSAALCAALLTAAGSPASAVPRHVVAGTRAPWASPRARTRSARSSERLRFRVYLASRDAAGAEAEARAVSDPASPRFRQYLSDAEIVARYSPTTEAVAAVRGWLSSAGFAVGEVPTNRQYVEATGTIDQINRAFDVSMGRYGVQGVQLLSPDRDLTVPGEIGAFVSAVIGTEQSQVLFRPDHVRPDTDRAQPASALAAGAQPDAVQPAPGFRNARPCSDYWGELQATNLPRFGNYPYPLNIAPCGYRPPQLRRAYGADDALHHGFDGTGSSVAIIDAYASPTIFSDAQTYSQRNDPEHVLTRAQFSQHIFPPDHSLEGPDQCDAAGWYGEETLDVEAVHAMAPGAHITYVGAASCEDTVMDKALNYVVSNHVADIISNSYGNLGEQVPAAEVTAFHQIVREAAMKGIGVYFSSGDSGDEVANLGRPEPDFPATDPWVTSVGGTSLGIGRDRLTVVETGWETTKSTLVGTHFEPPAPGDFLYGAGGGTSRLYGQPWYQKGHVPDRLAMKNHRNGAKGRVSPDISTVGDPNTGMLIGITQTFTRGVFYDQYRIGGTSLSCPLLAGLMAIADQITGPAHGFINPSLYARQGTRSLIDVKHVNNADVRIDFINGVTKSEGFVTSVRTFDYQGLAIHTTTGYDDVTGLGTPNGMPFLEHI